MHGEGSATRPVGLFRAFLAHRVCGGVTNWRDAEGGGAGREPVGGEEQEGNLVIS